MKTLTHDRLPDIGINPLTGEACAFGMRVLCDLSQEGVELVADYFGIKPDAFLPNWNSTVGGKPSVACVMLSREEFPLIARFALFREGYQYVVGRDTAVGHTGFSDDDMERNPGLTLYRDRASHLFEGENALRLWFNPRNSAVSSGSRNIHQATGRTE